MTWQDMLRVAGPQSASIGELWDFTLAVCSIVFVAVLGGFLVALWVAPRGSETTPPDLTSFERREPRLQWRVGAAVAASVVLLLVLLVASVGTDRAMAQLPLRDAVHVELTGHQWWWSVRYDDADPSRIFTTANEMHVPVGKPVIVTLRSDDVIHSLWVPNLTGKKDLIPGRTATLTFRADRAGVYRAQCAEFCGLQHAWMALPVTAEAPEQYEAWAARQRQPASNPTDAQALRGQQVFLGSTCVMCHAVAGTEAAAQHGPDLTHVASRTTLGAGVIPNDPQHLAAWIENPQAHKPGVNMPGHVFPRDDLQALVAWLGSLR
jgi:cytochrome c oxidase subunit 2